MTENEIKKTELQDIFPGLSREDIPALIAEVRWLKGIVPCTKDPETNMCKWHDVPALVAEVRQLRAERDAIIKVVVKNGQANCPGTSFNCKCQNPKEKDCGDAEECWLIWARNEVEKAKEI